MEPTKKDWFAIHPSMSPGESEPVGGTPALTVQAKNHLGTQDGIRFLGFLFLLIIAKN